MKVDTLVIGIGNPGRSDDGVGPRLAEKVESWGLPSLRALADYQLNIEHAAEVADSGLVIFIDASVEAGRPFSFYRPEPENRNDFSTHAMLPETVLITCREVYGKLPPAYVLAIRGENFAIGESFSDQAAANLAEAERFLAGVLRSADRLAACAGAISGPAPRNMNLS